MTSGEALRLFAFASAFVCVCLTDKGGISAITQIALHLVNKTMVLRGSWGWSCYSFVVLLGDFGGASKSCDDSLARRQTLYPKKDVRKSPFSSDRKLRSDSRERSPPCGCPFSAFLNIFDSALARRGARRVRQKGRRAVRHWFNLPVFRSRPAAWTSQRPSTSSSPLVAPLLRVPCCAFCRSKAAV